MSTHGDLHNNKAVCIVSPPHLPRFSSSPPADHTRHETAATTHTLSNICTFCSLIRTAATYSRSIYNTVLTIVFSTLDNWVSAVVASCSSPSLRAFVVAAESQFDSTASAARPRPMQSINTNFCGVSGTFSGRTAPVPPRTRVECSALFCSTSGGKISGQTGALIFTLPDVGQIGALYSTLEHGGAVRRSKNVPETQQE